MGRLVSLAGYHEVVCTDATVKVSRLRCTAKNVQADHRSAGYGKCQSQHSGKTPYPNLVHLCEFGDCTGSIDALLTYMAFL
jgi:hypothetical protein